jgi:predicted NAD-dependent protein-ADP-ribosyltransferase YbiA (DUF1768 family)
MKVILEKGKKMPFVVVVAECLEESAGLALWSKGREGHMFKLQINGEQSFTLHDKGRSEDACREPINALFTSSDPAVRLLSNLADTPFVLDGQLYGSVEGFWQGLYFTDEADRKRMAQLHGKKAKFSGRKTSGVDHIEYNGVSVRIGTFDHWQMMKRACSAKFSQHPEARRALLTTGDRPIVHKVRKDSKTIPGVIFADILMKVRKVIQKED